MQSIPVSVLLQNLSDEVARLADIAEGLDEMVGDLVAAGRGDSAALADRLQDADALRQSLHAIAQITASAARDTSATSKHLLSVGSLSEGVTLEKVRNACLRKRPPGDEQPHMSADKQSKTEAHSFFDEF